VKAVVQNRVDFFVSRAGADASTAELIAAIIREAGLVPFYQNEDFGHADFMRRMEQGYESSARMIALLSAEYQQSEFCRAEYNHVLAKDPANLQERLIVLRVATCDPVGSLQNLAYTDLVPVMSDRSALTRVVRAAIGVDRKSSDLEFWQP
jgi:TIR domain